MKRTDAFWNLWFFFRRFRFLLLKFQVDIKDWVKSISSGTKLTSEIQVSLASTVSEMGFAIELVYTRDYINDEVLVIHLNKSNTNYWFGRNIAIAFYIRKDSRHFELRTSSNGFLLVDFDYIQPANGFYDVYWPILNYSE